MIYVTYRNSYLGGRKVVKNIWNVDCEDVEQRYIEFMKEKAREINIVINPHWLNIMNWKDHNNHLSIEEYREKRATMGQNKDSGMWTIYFRSIKGVEGKV